VKRANRGKKPEEMPAVQPPAAEDIVASTSEEPAA
jgi:hypothetical protein